MNKHSFQNTKRTEIFCLHTAVESNTEVCKAAVLNLQVVTPTGTTDILHTR